MCAICFVLDFPCFTSLAQYVCVRSLVRAATLPNYLSVSRIVRCVVFCCFVLLCFYAFMCVCVFADKIYASIMVVRLACYMTEFIVFLIRNDFFLLVNCSYHSKFDSHQINVPITCRIVRLVAVTASNQNNHLQII